MREHKYLPLAFGIALLAVSGSAYFIAQWNQRTLNQDGTTDSEALKPIPLRSGRTLESFDYDWKGSRAKLTRIGESISYYRKYQDMGPPETWKSIQDAGLPADFTEMRIHRSRTDPDPGRAPQMDNGSDYYVVTKSQKMKVPPPKPGALGQYHVANYPDTDFIKLGWPEVLTEGQIVKALSKRGLETPILLDTNMYTHEELGAKVPRKVLVLRLSGKVEEIEAVPKNYLDIIMRK